MKKLIFIAIIAAFAVPAMANFTFTMSELMSFDVIESDPTTTLDTITSDHSTNSAGEYTAYGFEDSFMGSVGYIGNVPDNDPEGWLYIGLAESTVLDRAENQTYSMTIHNDNDDIWEYALKTSKEESDYVSLEAGESAYLTLDVSDEISSIGFVIQNGKKSQDTFHTSVTVPAPGAFLLGGLGLSLVGYIKRRRMLN